MIFLWIIYSFVLISMFVYLCDNRQASQQNSQVSRNEQLLPVPNDQGQYPADCGVDTPMTLSTLLVAGNESLPDSSVRNNWNRTKSLALLTFYGDAPETDTEDEQSERSRNRRLRVARKLGITKVQLNFAQMSL